MPRLLHPTQLANAALATDIARTSQDDPSRCRRRSTGPSVGRSHYATGGANNAAQNTSCKAGA